jgi:hypothetical protein
MKTFLLGITWAAGSKAEIPNNKGLIGVERIIPPQPKSWKKQRGYNHR